MAYARKTKGTKEAPYGFKPDGKPRGKPGRKTLPPEKRKTYRKKPKSEHKRPGPKPRVREKRGPLDKRSRRVDRGGFKKDGTPMPSMLDACGKITKEGASAMGKRGGGRPRGSYSLDTIIKNKLREMRGKGDDRETIGDAIIRLLLEQSVKSPMKRLAIARFLTERVDGKAVQPIKDVTPRNPLDELSDEELDRLIARRGKPTLSPVVDDDANDANDANDAKEESPSPQEGRPSETPRSADAPPPSPQPKPKTQPTKKKAGSSGLSS